MKPRQTLILQFSGILGLVLIGFWIASQFRLHQRAGELDEAFYHDDPQKIGALQVPFPLPAQENQYGDFCMNTLFPPRLEPAKEAFHRSLLIDPLSSRTWMLLAEAHLLQGDQELARKALEMSDLLDPNYPRERLESLRYWVLLGDRDRALEQGARMASLRGNNPRYAVQQLVESGISIPEIASATEWNSLTNSELDQVLRWFREQRPKQFSEAVSLIPKTNFADQPFLNRVARMAVELNQTTLALELWQKSNKQPMMVTPRFPLPFPDLAESPFREEFPLGWENPEEMKIKLRWRESLATESKLLKGPGVLWEMPMQPGDRAVIKVCRTVLLSGEEEFLLATTEIQGVREGILQLELTIGKTYLQSEGVQISENAPLRLRLALPPLAEPATVQVNLIVRPKTLNPETRRVRVLLNCFSGEESSK